MSATPDFADLGFSIFAYAAFFCTCGVVTAASHLLSPDRSFKDKTTTRILKIPFALNIINH